MLDLLKSRKFWISLIGLAALVIGSWYPQVQSALTAKSDALGGAISLLVVYMISLAVDPGAGWRGLLKSRKFYGLLIGLIIMILDIFGIVLPVSLTPETVTGICALVGGYIASVAITDRVSV